MPELELSELNIVIAVVGAFLILYSIISAKIKHAWYLGEVLPATVIGIVFGPVAAKFIDATKWGAAEPDQQNEITLGLCRVVIGIQLVMVGFQLPAQYQLLRWKEKVLGMLPIMTFMWVCTSACIYMIIPNVTWLSALVIGSCVACTDPVLAQAIAAGPFADKYVPLHLREMMSSEAGANDAFAFPSLMLATYLIRHAVTPGNGEANAEQSGEAVQRMEEVGRIGGGLGVALKMWVLEAWLFTVLLGILYGVIIGYGSCVAIKFALRRRWIDSDNLLLFPTAIALFILGTAGAMGTEDLLACYAAGNALNWNGLYQAEAEERRDKVNPGICSLLNFGAFMYIGSVMPWNEFNSPEISGITYPRLFALGFTVLLFRRIPATLLSYKLLPTVCTNAREALFMGYFSPIGISAIFFAEHTRYLFPELGEGDEEEFNLIASLGPTVYWLVLFSIVVHGLSVPLLNFSYKSLGIQTIEEELMEIVHFSRSPTLPRNGQEFDDKRSIMVFENRPSTPQLREKQDEKDLESGTPERRYSSDDDDRSLKSPGIKQEVKEMV